MRRLSCKCQGAEGTAVPLERPVLLPVTPPTRGCSWPTPITHKTGVYWAPTSCGQLCRAWETGEGAGGLGPGTRAATETTQRTQAKNHGRPLTAPCGRKRQRQEQQTGGHPLTLYGYTGQLNAKRRNSFTKGKTGKPEQTSSE